MDEEENIFDETEFKTYRNDRYGFEFSYPISDYINYESLDPANREFIPAHIVYDNLDMENRVLTPASSISERILVSYSKEPVDSFFEIEVPTTIISAIKTKLSAQAWLNSHKQDYFSSSAYMVVDDIYFDGKIAAEIIGEGITASPFKFIAIEMGDYLLVINHNLDSDFIIDTFRFTK